MTFVIITVAFRAHAQTVTSTELVGRAADYDGREVVYLGEVIGEVMLRRDHAWINVNDGETAIGVCCAKRLVQEIEFTGSYNFAGDQVVVTGVFHRACPEHGGTLDIHARDLKILVRGEKITHPVVPEKKKLGIVLPIVAALLALYYFVGRRRI